MPPSSPLIGRRQLLISAAATFALSAAAAAARTVEGDVPWRPFAASPPEPGWTGDWRFLTADEARAVGAVAECLIPADELSVSGKEAGCAEFIDGQLAGSYGDSAKLYRSGPFKDGTPEQGDQYPWTPRERYRLGLASLSEYCRKTHGAAFADLDAATRTSILQGLESGEIALSPVPSKAFFTQLLTNVMEGFFADPLYGGNRDMASWRMIGFPGARYDYRPYLLQYNTKLDLEPVSLAGRAAWSVGGGK
ncbi:MAG: gluconate 2-dehydrogenase [Rhodovulum sulfidophilum]|uniref:Gluconate 2-dehydrogenase n=1 Tax=Rhodovulum sulfidophilum TaxID=35806 RepID=A0A2W5N286_RHOSU|nr:MAG: gluconate 2-dehydrogenase [Rhodovulum sulfidophilum]